MTQDMLEYVFFHQILAEKFIEIAKSQQLAPVLIKEEMVWEVHLSEDMDDAIEQQLSETYDQLFEQDQDMYEQSQGGQDNEYQTAAIEITLKDGSISVVQTDQKIMGKLLSVLTFNEMNQWVSDIVEAVENPDNRSICKRHRDQIL